MPWYVLYTNPKAEKKVSEQLTKAGIVNYCPLITKVQQWSDRKKKIIVPLFSSYVFVNVDDNERNLVFGIKGVVRYLFWLGHPAIVKDEEIKIIQQWLTDETAEMDVAAIKPGDRMTVSDGPFKNSEGVVKEIGKNNVRLILETIGIVLTLKLPENNI